MADKQEETPLVIEALLEPLVEALKETNTQDGVPNEKLSWRNFVLVAMFYFIGGVKSGRRLITHLAHADPDLGLPKDLKKSTFFEGFRRFRAAQARQLFFNLLSRLSFFPVAEMAALGILCAVDGSHWPAVRSMTWAMVGVNKPTVLLHLAFGLNQMVPVSMLVTKSNSSERKALLGMVQVGVTYVADRGYFAYYLLHEIADASAFFVIRAPCSVTYTVLEVLPVNLPKTVDWLLDIQDLKVDWQKEEHGGTWRVVRFVIGKSQFILFTNRWKLSTWQIVTIYAYRWQIELLFLFVKRTMNGLHLLTHSYNGIQIQFYLMLSATLLLLHFKQRNEEATGANVPLPEPVQVQPVIGGTGETTRETSANADEVPRNTREVTAENAAETGKSVPAAPSPSIPVQDKAEKRLETSEELDKKTKQTEQAMPDAATTEGKPGMSPSNQTGSGNSKKAGASMKQPKEAPSRQGTIEDDDNARWYRHLGKNLATFWRISVHWLQALRDNLARAWDPAVFSNLPGYAKQQK